jgi:hypothetical protein
MMPARGGGSGRPTHQRLGRCRAATLPQPRHWSSAFATSVMDSTTRRSTAAGGAARRHIFSHGGAGLCPSVLCPACSVQRLCHCTAPLTREKYGPSPRPPGAPASLGQCYQRSGTVGTAACLEEGSLAAQHARLQTPRPLLRARHRARHTGRALWYSHNHYQPQALLIVCGRGHRSCAATTGARDASRLRTAAVHPSLCAAATSRRFWRADGQRGFAAPCRSARRRCSDCKRSYLSGGHIDCELPQPGGSHEPHRASCGAPPDSRLCGRQKAAAKPELVESKYGCSCPACTAPGCARLQMDAALAADGMPAALPAPQDGGTPLHVAARHGRISVAEVLVAHGANVEDPRG